MTEKDVKLHFIEAKVAMIKNDYEKLKNQVKECPECVIYINASRETLMHLAAEIGTAEMIEFLYNSGSDINRIEDNKMPICYAVRGNRIDNVKKLIELGAELNSEESVGNPLFNAMSRNNPQIAKLLINEGIDLTVQYSTRDDIWWDALSYAKYYGCHDICQMIIDKMKADGINYDSITPLTDDDFE